MDGIPITLNIYEEILTHTLDYFARIIPPGP
jgi:hypothetical protein